MAPALPPGPSNIMTFALYSPMFNEGPGEREGIF